MKKTPLAAVVAVLAASAVATLVATTEPARAQSEAPVATLTGEDLIACRSGFTLTCAAEQGDFRIRTRCTSTDTGTVSWKTTAGLASGPYPGTFTEKGRAAFTNGQLTSLAVTFHIDSASGVVEGRKFLPRPLSRAGFCYDTGFGTFQSEIFPLIRYKAMITAPTGCRYADEGQGFLHMFGLNDESPFVGTAQTTIGFLGESFTSDLLFTRPTECAG